MGAIHSTKISGNFGPKLNGSVRSNRKSFEKTGPPFEVVLFSRSDRSEFWLNGSRPMSYENSSKRQRPFWLLICARKLLRFSAQSKGSRPWSHFVRSYTQRTWSSAVRHVYLGCSRRCICDYLTDKYAEPFAGIITVAYLKVCENIHWFTYVSLFYIGCMDIS